DDACSLPLSDTLRVTVAVNPPANARARFIKPTSKYVKDAVREGETRSWDIEGIDPDNDFVSLRYSTNGFTLEEYGFRFANNDFFNQIGSVKNTLTWDPRCDKYPFFKQNNFIIKFLVDDLDYPCNINPPDTLIFDLSIQEFPKNAAPTISTSGLGAPPDAKVIKVSRTILEPLNFWVFGNDTDNDFLQLNATGEGFNMIDLGVSFPNVTGNGSVSSEFKWNIKCDKINLATKNTYGFKFILIDNLSKCRFYKADTLLVELEILKPNNIKPVIFAFRNTTKVNPGSTSEFLIGQPIEINLVGTDGDRLPMDTLSLSLIEANGDLKPQGYQFTNVRGLSGIQSLFSWSPDCSIFKNNIYSNVYSFKFNISDNRCLNPLTDIIELKVAVSDVGLNQKPFYMPNIITPNGDKHNDYFALEGFDEAVNLDDKVSLPLDNCVQKFESVKIFNRWGDMVFQSTDRKFKWYASHEAAGVYYYVVKYNNRMYKSHLSVQY
ncbi:MAG: gliding motility-associated C-terminal domain-containing protein, partial [Flammeovirgaceae bacterium]